MRALKKSGEHLLDTLHPNQISKLVESFLNGIWPPQPVPTVFQYTACLANTLEEQAQVVADILQVAINPVMIEAFYYSTDWDKTLKTQLKAQKTKIAHNDVQKPSLMQFTIQTMGDIMRAIGTSIANAKNNKTQNDDVMLRLTHLKFHLAGKPYLIQAALKNPLVRSAWKNHMYGMGLHEARLVFYPTFKEQTRYLRYINQKNLSVVLADTSDKKLPLQLNEAVAAGLTVDDYGHCSGFCGVSVHCEPDITDQHRTQKISQTLHAAAKHALRLIATLPNTLESLDDRAKIQELMRNIAEQILSEINLKTDEKRAGVALLVYRAIKVENHLYIIGFNIGNSILLLHSSDNTFQTLTTARQFETNPHDILLGEKFHPYFDTILINEPQAPLDCSLVALSPGAQKAFERSAVSKLKKSQRKYIEYTLSETILDAIQNKLAPLAQQGFTAEAITQAFQEQHQLATPKNQGGVPTTQYGTSLSITAMKIPANTLLGVMKGHAQGIPVDSPLIYKRKQRIKTFLADQFRKEGLYATHALHITRMLATDFDNLYDFASYLEAERNALPTKLISETKLQIILADALAIFEKEFEVETISTTKDPHCYLLTDCEQDVQGIYFNPFYNRMFASQILACAFNAKDDAKFKPNFHEKQHPEITVGLATIGIAGPLAKRLIRCHCIADYETWIELAKQKLQFFPRDSEMSKTLKKIVEVELPKAVALPTSATTAITDHSQTKSRTPSK